MLLKKRPVLYFLLLALVLPALLRPAASATAQVQGVADSVTVNVAGLSKSVTIRRDDRGIPYIEATNEADLYFAQGYVTATDRLWQMDVLRRTVRGELSEIFGRLTLEEDKKRRLYGFAQLSESMLAKASGPARAALESYARGVNAYIETHDLKQLPKEFQILQYRPRAWTPADSLAIGKIFAEALSTTWQSDLRRAAVADLSSAKREILFAESSPFDVLVVGKDGGKKATSTASFTSTDSNSIDESAAVLRELTAVEQITARSLERVGLYMPDRAASNNWVVAGSRTASGKPLLANDPHLPAVVPSIWYMTHLSMPGMRVAGVTAPGTPGVILGHNEYIAWGSTNLGPDVQDLYIEKFDKENPRKYMTPVGWREAEVRREEIKIRKGFTDAGTESEFIDVTVTRHGPIIFEKNGTRYALRWTSLDPDAVELDAFFNVNRARNWKEFRAALSNYGGATQNFVYADREGHIGYYGAGRIPIRRSGDGSLPYDGSTDAGEWTSYIPFDKLPNLYDPPEGFIVSANQRVVGQSYPYHLTHEWASPYRARRIYDFLKSNTKVKPDDMRDIQADLLHLGLLNFAREMIKLAGESDTSHASSSETKWRTTIEMFARWDGRMKIESPAAPLVTETRVAFRRRILEALLGPERSKDFSWANDGAFLDRIVTERPEDWLPKGMKNYLELFRASEAEARESLTNKLGADESKWTWGNYRPTRLRHPLAGIPLIGDQFGIAPFPQNGSGGTVNVGPYVSMRLIATLDNWDLSRQGIATGESGDPSSTHYKDQIDDWLAVTPAVFPFSKEAVAKSTQVNLLLAPAK
jgi:penicillin G amidase